MTTLRPVECDERAVAVANASYRWAYTVQAFGLLAVMAFPSLTHQEAERDLFGVMVLGGAVATGYQIAQRTVGRRWLAYAAMAVLSAAAIAALAASVWRR